MKRFIQFLSILLIFVSSVFTQDVSRIVFSAIDNQGRAFRSLTNDDISLTIGKNNAKIGTLQSEANAPLEVILIIDVTPSQEKVLPLAKKIALSFVDQLLTPSKDYIAIATFSNTEVKLTTLTNDFIEAKKNIDEVKLSSGGGSYIWDNTSFICEKGFSQNKDRQKLLVLFSDGFDTSTFLATNVKDSKFITLSNLLIKEKIRLFSFYNEISSSDSSSGIPASAVIIPPVSPETFEISQDSGGKVFRISHKTKDENIIKALNEIKQLLLGTYSIQFSLDKLTNATNFEKVKIKIQSKIKERNGVSLSYPKLFYFGK